MGQNALPYAYGPMYAYGAEQDHMIIETSMEISFLGITSAGGQG